MLTGVAGATAVAAALGVVATTRSGRELLDDDRVVHTSWPQTALHVGVLIPLGTVVLEEVTFRGVLPALLDPAGRSGRPDRPDPIPGLRRLAHRLEP